MRDSKDRIVINPFGVCESIAPLHGGTLFDLFAGRLGPTRVCLKFPKSPPSSGGCYEGRIEHGSELFGETGLAASPRPEDLALLLQLEVETIRRTRGAWNHSVIGLGAIAETSQPVSVMPFYEAAPLSSLTADEKRVLFPRMLPSLWDALSIQPHCDLSEDNILIDKRNNRFILIDPGVYLGDAAGERVLFTTNAANYPLLFPYAHVTLNAWHENRSLSEIPTVPFLQWEQPSQSRIEQGGVDLLDVPVARARPAAPDLLAVGLMLHSILNGEPQTVLRFAEQGPAWAGPFVTPRRFPMTPHPSRVAEAIAELSAVCARFPPKIEALLRGLILLEAKSRGDLERLVRDSY